MTDVAACGSTLGTPVFFCVPPSLPSLFLSLSLLGGLRKVMRCAISKRVTARGVGVDDTVMVSLSFSLSSPSLSPPLACVLIDVSQEFG